MRRKKYTLFNFCTGDFKGVEQYLNRQAAKGWKLDKVGVLLGRFIWAERDDQRWCVDLADPKREREEEEDYLGLCAEGGWDLAAKTNNMYLFCSRPGLRPAPVQTDPELERKNYYKYYIKSTILSVLIIAGVLAVWALLAWAMGSAFGTLEDMERAVRFGWMESWTIPAVAVALGLWLVSAVWRVGDFLAALVRNRQELRPPRPWTMWVSAVVSSVMVLAWGVVVLGAAGDALLTGEGNTWYLPILLGAWGVFALYRWLSLDKDLFSGERRLNLKVGLVCLALTAALGAGMALTPFGEWSSYDDPEAEEQYVRLESAPVVRAEDLGTAEDRRFYWVLHTVTPVGERWKVDDFMGESVIITGCETYLCPTVWQAKALARTKVEEAAWSVDPGGLQDTAGADMALVDLPWADEVWYGQWTEGELYVLVVRVGRQVTRLSSWEPLMTEEALAAIEARVTR